MIEHAYAKVNGVTLHYAYSGRGALMLFLHGFPEFWYAWRAQLDEFGRDHLAVAPDLRGFNLSEKPQALDAYRARHIVDDVLGLADALGRERFVLVAHDWGGAVAWQLAAAHPERVERLIILNAPHPVTFARELANNPAQIEASAYMLLLRMAKAERVLLADECARLFRMMRGADGRDWMNATDRAAYLAAWTKAGALTGALNYYRASPLYPPSESDPGARALNRSADLYQVRVPTLVIWGERDSALLPGNLDGLDELVTPLRIVRVPTASHWIAHEEPERVIQLVRDFL